MNSSEFEKFKEVVKNANQDSPIWWAGFLWLDLTQEQIKNICKILKNNKAVIETAGQYILPSKIKVNKGD